MRDILTHHETRKQLELTLNQAAVLNEIHRACGFYCPSGEFDSENTRQLADKLGLTDTTVRNILNDLIESKHIINVGEGKRKNSFLCKPSEDYLRKLQG